MGKWVEECKPLQEIDSILVVGAKGMLGSGVVATLYDTPWRENLERCQFHAVDLEEIDITKPASVQSCFDTTRPQLVINCAA